MFEEAAGDHARRLVLRGELPQDLVLGRWWAASGKPAEVAALALQGSRTALLGEARWQQQPLDVWDLETRRRKVTRVPHPGYALWARNGARPEVLQAGALGFTAEDVLNPDPTLPEGRITRT